jgi:1,4-dihydroxy-2-naphthoate octaprenyltransferase
VAKLVAFLRIARPHFLLGGLGLFALGALVAQFEGWTLTIERYALGQGLITALQLMAHYLNEYWDEAGDRRNTRRTWFSGGSGVLAEKGLARETVFAAAMVNLAVAVAIGVYLVTQHFSPALLIIISLIALGLFFQSTPPVALMGSGYGELITAIVFAGLVPAFAHLLWSPQASAQIMLATGPLVLLHIAMLIAFGLPDYEADKASDKQTLVVRLGQAGAASLHNALLVLALVLAAAATFAGLPPRVAISLALCAPLVVLQILLVRRLREGQGSSFAQLTLLAALTFGLSVYFVAFSYWVLGSSI